MNIEGDAAWPEVVGSAAHESRRRFLDDTEVSPSGMGVDARYEHVFSDQIGTLGDFQFKTIIVGDSGVGKTQLVNMIVHDRSDFSLPGTRQYDRYETLVEAREGFCVRIDIWDTAGQDLYNAIVPMFFHNAVMGIVAYAVNSRSSFESAKRWLARLCDTGNASRYPCASMPPTSGPPAVVLLATKVDVANHMRCVTFEEGAKLAEEHNIAFAEVSCIQRQNRGEIQHILSDLVRQVLSAVEKPHRETGRRRRANSTDGRTGRRHEQRERDHANRRSNQHNADHAGKPDDVPSIDVDRMVRVVKENGLRVRQEMGRDRSDIEFSTPATDTCC